MTFKNLFQSEVLMLLNLTSEEKGYLDLMLQRYLGELSLEISRTDTRAFRDGLKHEADVLQVLKIKIETEEGEKSVGGFA
jgi:hypothetical protein